MPSLGLEEEERELGEAADVDAQRNARSAVVRTSTRQTIFLPIPGLVDPNQLKPSDLVGTNKDSYLILEKLPEEFDSRVQAMEVDEKPTEEYSDIGGCDLQIQELIEAVVLPMTHKDMFDAIGIRPPKGVLLHGAFKYSFALADWLAGHYSQISHFLPLHTTCDYCPVSDD